MICACVTREVADGDRQPIVRDPQDPPDEARLLELVDRHRVAPLFLRGLAAVDGSRVPERLREAVRARARVNSARALRQTAELLTLVEALDRAGIPALPMKGVALAAQVYGDLSLRLVGDIDLLVGASRVPDAERILMERGYARSGPRQPLTPRQIQAFMRERKHFHYVHPESGMHVELHWRCVNNPRLFPIGTDELLARARPAQAGGVSLPAMAPDDLMLFLCVHGANHAWFRLLWLFDVHQLLTNEVLGPDLDAVRNRARDLGLERVLLQACILTNELLHTRVPPAILDEARADPAVMELVEVARRALVEHEKRWWVAAPLPDLWRQTSYRLKLRPKLAYKLRGLKTLMFNADDWQAVALPDRAFPLYFLLRPLLAIKRRLTGGSPPRADTANR